MFRKHLDAFGVLQTSPQEFADEFKELLSIGRAQAISSGSATAPQRASRTLAATIHQLSQQGEFLSADPRAAKEAANLILKSFERAPLDPFGPVDLDATVRDSFGPALATLALKTPSKDLLAEARRLLSRSLVERPKGLRELRELEDYFNKHVENEVLKTSLLGDVRDRIRRTEILIDPELKGIRRPVPLIEPISATKALVLQRPLLAEFGINVNQKVAQWQSELRSQNPRRGMIIADARRTIDRLNKVFRQIQFKPQGASEILQIKPGKTSALKITERLSRLAALIDEKPSRTFTYVPSPSEGRLQDPQQIINMLQDILMGPHPSIHRAMVPHPVSIRRFGAIEVRRESGADPSVREIIIPREASLEDVMKLAQSLTMEDGVLEDLSGEEVFEIKKGEKPGSIVSYFQALLDQAGGTVVRVLYTPSGFGEFLDGSLADIIHGGSLMGAFDNSSESMAKTRMLKMGLGDFSQFGGALPLAIGAAVLAKPIAGIADKIGKAVPALKIITAPVKAIASVVSGIAKLFGF